MIPKSDHSQSSSILSKQKELEPFVNYDVYKIVEKPTTVRIIGTQWVLVVKDVQGPKIQVKKKRSEQAVTELGQAQLKLGLDFTLNFCTIKI